LSCGPAVGVEVNHAAAVVAGNFIGTDPTGKTALGNYAAGVLVDNGSADTVIGPRNVISGNGSAAGGTGVVIGGGGPTQNYIAGNLIGTDASGMNALGNVGPGVYLATDSGQNYVGNRNIISGNITNGIEDDGNANTLVGNYIGTNAFGTAALPNGCDGILLFDASNTLVGFSGPASRNVISGNGLPGGCSGSGYGVDVSGATTGAQIEGNYIGTSSSGATALGNLAAGIILQGTSNHTQVGGFTAAAKNVVSGNADDGIDALDSGYDTIAGNFIGTNAGGTGPLGNVNFGVYVTSSNSRIGENVIAFNGAKTALDGVQVDTGTGNTISGNSIFSNGGLGISLVNNGNNNQSAPVIDSVTTVGTTTEIKAHLVGVPNETYVAEFFASAVCDPSGGGEGQKLIASDTDPLDAGGNLSYDIHVHALSPAMKVVTATATRLSTNDTSGFSNCSH
jgi:hypothetical protein